MQINKKWLDSQLKELNVNNGLLDKVAAFKNHVETVLKHKLSSSKWTFIEFFILSIATHVVEELLSDHLYQFTLNGNQCYLRRLNKTDIERITKKYQQYYYEKLILLKLLSTSKDLTVAEAPIKWINLIVEAKEEFDIPLEIISYYINDSTNTLEIESKSTGIYEFLNSAIVEPIRFNHYQLDPNIAKEGLAPVERFNINEAANFLNVSEDNLMLRCFQNHFGAYLKEGSYEISRTICKPITQSTIEELSISSYPYHYEGLVRLLKDSSPFGKVETSLKALYNGSDIRVDIQQSNYILVRLQSSLAETIQGICKYITLSGTKKITKDDLIFIKSELGEFKIKQISCEALLSYSGSTKQEKALTTYPTKQNRTHGLHEIIKEIFYKCMQPVDVVVNTDVLSYSFQ